MLLDLVAWVPSITNMLWNSFSTSVGMMIEKSIGLILILAGNHQLLKEKILSIESHITNIHTFPNNTQHKACGHLHLPEEGRDKAWLKPDSLVET